MKVKVKNSNNQKQENIGLTKSLNKLINKATGKVYRKTGCWLDVSLEYRIETLISSKKI